MRRSVTTSISVLQQRLGCAPSSSEVLNCRHSQCRCQSTSTTTASTSKNINTLSSGGGATAGGLNNPIPSTTTRVPLVSALGLSKRVSNILGRSKPGDSSSSSGMLLSSSNNVMMDCGFVVSEEVPTKLLCDWRPWVGGKEDKMGSSSSGDVGGGTTSSSGSKVGSKNGTNTSSAVSRRTIHRGRRAPGSTDIAVSSTQVSTAQMLGVVEDITVGFSDALISKEKLSLIVTRINSNHQQVMATTAPANTLGGGNKKSTPSSPSSSSSKRANGGVVTTAATDSSAGNKDVAGGGGGPYTMPTLRMVLTLPGERECEDGQQRQRVVVLCPLSTSLCQRLLSNGTSEGDVVLNINSSNAILENLTSKIGVEIGARVIVAGSLRTVLRCSVDGGGGVVPVPTSFIELPQDGAWSGAVTVL